MSVANARPSSVTRYTYGGEEFILVEFAEEMSLETNLRVQSIAAAVENRCSAGIVDVCPANVSCLVRFDPDVVAGDDVIDLLQRTEREVLAHDLAPFKTRIVDIPILFNDPWTHEVVMKFRDRVQDPTLTDIEYLAKVNGLSGTEEFVAALTDTPCIVTMTGFVPGVVWSYKLAPRTRQLEGPKYLRPRTETPDRAFALGGAYQAIYPAPSAGGYPIFGRAAAPVYDPHGRLPDFRDTSTLVRIGDVYNYRSVDRDSYDEIGREVAAGTFRYLSKPIEFEPEVFLAQPDEYCKHLVEALYG